VESPIHQPQTTTARRPRPALTMVDYLVIAATVFTFLVVLSVNHSRAKAEGRTSLSAIELPAQTSQLPDAVGLIKARIGLAIARPWS
jgi:hypothetical protein